MRQIKRAVSILLSTCMAVGLMLPAVTSAQAEQGQNEYDKSIVMVDCGRKYFSVDSLKSIMDAASSAGMHYIMLGIGNDGLRLLLDDMSLTVGETTYTSEQVSAAVHRGNEAYSDFPVDELTQAEMDELLSYAGSIGMEIIPLVNSPGHMDAILDAAEELTGETCAYGTSQRTIDVTNETAIQFTQAMLSKYIHYFAGKGCTMFNMGCDEYANDDPNVGMGFPYLVKEGQYGNFVTYVNQVAALVKEAGMSPIAFNDGIYYNQITSEGTFDKDIIISYWSSGWWGYDVASASYLASMGHKMINTHGDYYWVMGHNKCTVEKAAEFDIQQFMQSVVDDPVGAMFCIWADVPQDQTDVSVAEEVAPVIASFGSTLPETAPRYVHEVIDHRKDALEAAYTYALTLPTQGVTAEAKAAFEQALAQAQAVLDNPDVTQEQIDGAWRTLSEGIWRIGYTQGTGAELELLIDKVDGMAAEEDRYVPAQWAKLQQALTAARDAAAGGDAQTIAAAAQALLEAVQAQQLKADKTALAQAIAKAEGMELKGYTDKSVEAFRTALAEAKKVMDNENLTQADQAVVDGAVAALAAAEKGLTAVESAPETSQKPQQTQTPQAGGVPSTGDSAQLGLYVVVVAVAACLLCGAVVLERKHMKK